MHVILEKDTCENTVIHQSVLYNVTYERFCQMLTLRGTISARKMSCRSSLILRRELSQLEANQQILHGCKVFTSRDTMTSNPIISDRKAAPRSRGRRKTFSPPSSSEARRS